MKAFYVYMMTNRNRAVLYTGITSSLMRRVSQHQNSEIEGFTKTYKVNLLVYYERYNDPRDAIGAFSAYASRSERNETPHMTRAHYENVFCVIKHLMGGPSLCSG